jgi:hypothetical protein
MVGQGYCSQGTQRQIYRSSSCTSQSYVESVAFIVRSILKQVAVLGLTETAERYSTFNTTHFLEEYEPNMIKASNMSAKSLAKYQARETWEDGWQTLAKEVAESTTVEPTSLLDRRLAYLSAWLEMELSLPEQGTKNKGKGKGRETDSPKLEPFYVIMVFERMLSVASFRTERTSKVNESLIWLKYYRFMVSDIDGKIVGRNRG